MGAAFMAIVKLSEVRACDELEKVLPTGEILSPDLSCWRMVAYTSITKNGAISREGE